MCVCVRVVSYSTLTVYSSNRLELVRPSAASVLFTTTRKCECGAKVQQTRSGRAGKSVRITAMLRLKVISGHLSRSGSPEPKRELERSACAAASPDDVVVVHGVRTAVTKAKRGGFKVTWADPGSADLWLTLSSCWKRHFSPCLR